MKTSQPPTLVASSMGTPVVICNLRDGSRPVEFSTIRVGILTVKKLIETGGILRSDADRFTKDLNQLEKMGIFSCPRDLALLRVSRN